MKKTLSPLFVLLSVMALASCSPSNASSSPSIDHGSLEEVETREFYYAELDSLNSDYAASLSGRQITFGFSSLYGTYKPMVSFTSYIDNVYLPMFELETNVSIDEYPDGIIYTFKDSPKGTIDVNFSDCTITFSNYDRVVTGFDECILDPAAVTLNDYSHIAYASSYPGFVEKGDATIFRLGDYGLPLYEKDAEPYIPVEIANYIFFSRWTMSLVYNGTDFYLYDGYSTMVKDGGRNRTSFAESYYAGALAEVEEKSEKAAYLDGKEMMFFLDHFYGFRDRDDLSEGWESYLESDYPSVYEGLFSTDPDAYDGAIDSLMRTVIGDGHTAVSNSDIYGNTGSFYEKDRINAAPYSERLTYLLNERNLNSNLRAEAFGSSSFLDHMVESSGDTGIIRFDSFALSGVEPKQSDSTYYTYRSSDNYALFVYAFRTFAERGVKRVVIDLTCNSGGSISACISALGFLMDDVPYAVYSPLTGGKGQYKVNIDCNADGTISGHESYADDFSFYVLTSNFSFSCGNIFPTIAKEAGIPIIGADSAGGACAVHYAVAPNGQPFQISGLSRSSKTFEGGKTHADEGIEVDYEVAKDYWYDISSLDTYLGSMN